MYGEQLTGEALPCFRWYTMRKLIQQSKTVEPNSTCQHRFISTGQTRPPLFPWRIYISNANWTCPFFIVSPAALICGRDRRNREWAAGRERRGEEGRGAAVVGTPLHSRRPRNTGSGLERINIMSPHNCIYTRAGAAPCSDCKPGSGVLIRTGRTALFVTRAVY